MMRRVSSVSGTCGRWKAGRPPWIEAMSPTRGTSMPNADDDRGDDADAGQRRRELPGSASASAQMIAMVSATSASITASGQPVSQAPAAMPWPVTSAPAEAAEL